MDIRRAIVAIVLAVGMTASASGAPSPYPRDAQNFMYNLLFCDEPDLFQHGSPPAPGSDMAIALSESSNADDVRRIADNAKGESRLRAVAYNWLRRHGQPVPAKILLGVIVEVALKDGLDTLAVFADGRIRYLNRGGPIAVIENDPPGLRAPVEALLASSRKAIDVIGPWDKPRRDAPVDGNVRLTFLVSDGLYFGEGAYDNIARDGLAGPVLGNAIDVLNALPKPGTE